MSHADSINSVAFSVAVYRLSHQSTHLHFESNWFSQFLRKNKSIQGYQLSRVESYTSLQMSLKVTALNIEQQYVAHSEELRRSRRHENTKGRGLIFPALIWSPDVTTGLGVIYRVSSRRHCLAHIRSCTADCSSSGGAKLNLTTPKLSHSRGLAIRFQYRFDA